MAQGPHIADGFADDCDELIHQCLQETPVTYLAFCKVFKRMQMPCVFHDRQSGSEIAELTEELVNIAKYHMVANTCNYEASIVGLFLVYALIKIQPFEDFAYLRLAPDDVQYVERIELVARRHRRLDVLYVLGSVLTQHTRYCAAARERGMEPAYRKYLENGGALDNLGQRPKGVFLRQNEELDILKELSEIQLRYDNAKAKAKVPDLKYVDSKFPNALNTSLKNVVAGILEDGGANDSEEEEEEIVNETARNIKDKAMKLKVDPMKHLVRVEDRTPKTRSNAHVSDIKTAPGKIKTGGSNKNVHSSSIRKHTGNSGLPNIRTIRRQKRKHSSDSSDTNDEEMPDLSDPDSDTDNDIDLDTFTKESTSQDVKNTTLDNKNTVLDNMPEETIEVEIDSSNIKLTNLPCLITSDDNGKTYEIEIIDQVQQTKDTYDPSDVPAMKPEYKDAIEHEKIARKEKRDLKKPILKSRFKRMGMEPIAFKPTKE